MEPSAEIEGGLPLHFSCLTCGPKNENKNIIAKKSRQKKIRKPQFIVGKVKRT